MSEKPKNLIFSIGARSLHFGIEGYAKPVYSFNAHHFGKDLQLSTEVKSYDRDHSISFSLDQCLKPSDQHIDKINKAYREDLRVANHLFPSDLLIFQNYEKSVKVIKFHLWDIIQRFFKKTGVGSINRKIILVWCDETPRVYLDLIVEICLKRLYARSVVVVSDLLMSGFGAGIGLLAVASGDFKNEIGCLVIDFGWRFTRIGVLYDNRVLDEYTLLSTRSGCQLHYDLVKKFSEKGVELRFKDYEMAISHLTCFDPSSELAFTLGNKKNKFTEGQFIKLIISSLFTGSKNDDTNQMAVDKLAYNVFQSLPIDLKIPIMSKIVITGGLSRIPGFGAFVLNGLNKQLPSSHNENLKFEAVETLGSWSGASLYSSIIKNVKGPKVTTEFRRDL